MFPRRGSQRGGDSQGARGPGVPRGPARSVQQLRGGRPERGERALLLGPGRKEARRGEGEGEALQEIQIQGTEEVVLLLLLLLRLVLLTQEEEEEAPIGFQVNAPFVEPGVRLGSGRSSLHG